MIKNKLTILLGAMFFIAACDKEQDTPLPNPQPEEKPIEKASLQKLSIKQLPHKTIYGLDEELDLYGLQLTGLYSDGKEYPVTATSKQVGGFASTVPIGRLDLTINIEEKQVSFNVQVAPVRIQAGILTEVLKGYSEIILPSHVESIGTSVFQGNKQIKRVVLNEGLTLIGKDAFFNSSIEDIVFPSTLEKLEEDIFYYCYQLKQADLSHTQLTEIPSGNFINAGIEEVLLPPTLKSIMAQAFLSTQKLKSVIIPQNVKFIGQEAFRNSGITTIQLPNGISTIADRAFYYCPNLTEVLTYGPASDEDANSIIQDYCFVGCPNLSHLEIPQSIRILGQGLINGNQKITKLTIPSRVTQINFSAFDHTAVKEVYVEAILPPATPNGAWYGFPDNITLITVPAQSLAEYKAAKGWNTFAGKITSRP